MTLYTEGLTLARAADDRIAVARLLLGLGGVARAQGEVGYAAACYQESLAIGRALDDRRRIAWALHTLGELALEQGAHERAADAFAEGLALARAFGDQENTARLLYFMGRLLLDSLPLIPNPAKVLDYGILGGTCRPSKPPRFFPAINRIWY